MNSSLKVFAVGLAMALGVLAPAAARADFVLGTTFIDNQLISVDTTTGIGTLVGPLGANVAPFGLATAGDRLVTFDSVADVIRQINPATGGTQAIFNIGIGPVLGQGGLAFQSNNVGFLTSALDPTTLNPVNNLYRFDIGTGTSMLIASTSVPIEALAFDSGGTLFGLGKLNGNLYTINTTSGATTLVGNTGVSIGSPTGGLTFGPGGVLFATLDDKLFTLNRTTGAAAPVGSPDPLDDTGFSSISGLAFAPRAVPEPSSLALLSTAIGLAGVIAVRRRRK